MKRVYCVMSGTGYIYDIFESKNNAEKEARELGEIIASKYENAISCPSVISGASNLVYFVELFNVDSDIAYDSNNCIKVIERILK